LTAWAEQLMDDTGQLNALPANIRGYFDFEAFARDAELGGDILAINTNDGLTHVFWAR
jgi:antirestriction protein